jgi:hypothetical protein
MALSDVDKEKDLTRSRNRPVVADTNLRWSDKQKLEAVQSWLVLGNLSLVGRILGIPRITLATWKASAWWKEAVDDIKLQEKIELSNKMKKIVEAAHLVVEDRLVNGDAVVTKTGQIIRKPVNMRDAHRVAVDLQNQRDAVDKASKEPGLEDEGSTDRLEQLANKFAEFATKSIEKSLDKKRTVDVPYVEIIEKEPHAVHEEREARLQDGVPEVPQSS